MAMDPASADDLDLVRWKGARRGVQGLGFEIGAQDPHLLGGREEEEGRVDRVQTGDWLARTFLGFYLDRALVRLELPSMDDRYGPCLRADEVPSLIHGDMRHPLIFPG